MICIKKNHIFYFINFFIMISIGIVLLISLYYITPDNYIDIEKKIKLNKNIKSYKLSINPKSQYILEYNTVGLNKFAFNKNINLIFKNIIKSQNINYKKNYLFTSNYSDIIITNNSDKILDLELYLV